MSSIAGLGIIGILIIGAVILGIILIALVGWVITTYNSLVKARNKVDNQFSQIDVQLKKRFDLIPNIVETVKGYTSYESDTLEKVIKARNQYLTATTPEDKMAASNEVSSVMTKLFALSESYPELKADTNYQELIKTLQDVEDKIAYARQFYNDAVMMYNQKVQSIPTNIIAGIFKFHTISYLVNTEEERQNVKVDFDTKKVA